MSRWLDQVQPTQPTRDQRRYNRPRRTPGTLNPLAAPAVDEGNNVDIADLAERFAAINPDARAHIKALAVEAARAGYPFSVSQRPSVRRYHIGQALVTIYTDTELDPPQAAELIRCFIAHITGDDATQRSAIPLGAVIGALSVADAYRFATLADTFTAGRLALTIAPDGHMCIPTGPALPVEDDPFAS